MCKSTCECRTADPLQCLNPSEVLGQRRESCSSRCQRHTSALFPLASPQRNIGMTEGKRKHHNIARRLNIVFPEQSLSVPVKVKWIQRATKRSEIKANYFQVKWGWSRFIPEILVRFVDNTSGRMELKLTGRPYQQIWNCSGMLICALHFLGLLLGFQSALDDLLLTFSAVRPYILVIIQLCMEFSDCQHNSTHLIAHQASENS